MRVSVDISLQPANEIATIAGDSVEEEVLEVSEIDKQDAALEPGSNRGIYRYRPKHDRVAVLETQSYGARTSEGNQPNYLRCESFVKTTYAQFHPCFLPVFPLQSPDSAQKTHVKSKR